MLTHDFKKLTLIQEGPEECHDKKVDTLVDVPEETCDLNPQKTCRLVTKLVPSLKPKQVNSPASFFRIKYFIRYLHLVN